MRDSTIARNYAEALLELARRAKDLEGWGQLLAGVADAVGREPKLRAFLETPRVDTHAKIAVLRKALADRAPSAFVRFIESVVRHRRQMLIPEIAMEYADLVDEAANRLHADVTLAREPDAQLRKVIAERLSRAFAREVLPHITVDPRVLGGMVVRVGDTVIDGSVQRKLNRLRGQLLTR